MTSRSFVDAVSNLNVFAHETFGDATLALLDPLESPPESALPTFLHEATHHWCFSSLVGTTAGILNLRGNIRLFRAIEAKDPSEREKWERDGTEDITRSEVLFALFRPLAEGLATFAEFSLFPDHHNPAMPAPLRWVVMWSGHEALYGQRDEPFSNRIRRRIDAMAQAGVALQVARSQEAVAQRKLLLLTQPLSCENSDGYLAGYLAVLNMKRHLADADERFFGSEMFLLFAYDYFYNDEGLVRLLLDELTTAPDSISRIFAYVHDRLRRFFHPEVEASLDSFYDRLRAQSARDSEEILPRLDVSDADPVATFLRVWSELMGDTFERLPRGISSRSPSDEFTIIYHSAAYSRDLLHLGKIQGRALLDDSACWFTYGDRLRIRLPKFDSAPEGIVDAVAELYLGTRSGNHVVCVRSDDKICGLVATPALEPDQVNLLRSVLGHVMLENQHVIAEPHSEALSSLSKVGEVGAYLRQTSIHLDQVYLPVALVRVPKPELDEVARRMKTTGFYGLLDKNRDLVRAMAVLHSPWLLPTREWASDRLREIGLEDHESVLMALESYSSRFNLFHMGFNGRRLIL